MGKQNIGSTLNIQNIRLVLNNIFLEYNYLSQLQNYFYTLKRCVQYLYVSLYTVKRKKSL